MREKSLLIIAVCVSVIGLVVLAVVRPEVSPQLLELEGKVDRVDERGRVSFIRFQPHDFTVIAFEGVDIEEGDQVLLGRLKQYKGKVEFVVESTAGSPVE